MKMELIQPFINAADAVYRRHSSAHPRGRRRDGRRGPTAEKAWPPPSIIHGDIEGRVIFDIEAPDGREGRQRSRRRRSRARVTSS